MTKEEIVESINNYLKDINKEKYLIMIKKLCILLKEDEDDKKSV